MTQLIRWFITILLISSCTYRKNDPCTIKKSINSNDLNKSLNNSEANIDDITSFFDVKIDSNNEHKLIFLKKNESEPVRWIGVEDRELQQSKIISQNNFSVLVLYNPAESSVDLFYKQNKKKVNSMIEDKYFPDSIIFNQLNDTLLVCQYYWKYQLGPNLSNVRKYYFIGEKSGVFKFVYNCVGSALKLDDFTIQDGGVLLKNNENKTSLLVLSDTLKHFGSLKNEIIFKPYRIHFKRVTFSKSL